MGDRPSIVLGVTADMSLTLMRGFPQYMAEHGWDVHVVCSPGPMLEQLRGLRGVTAHGIAMVRDPSIVADLRALVAWIRLLKVIRPDVISVGTPKAGLLGGIAGLVTRVPKRVYMLRGLRMETTRGMQRAILAAVERLTMASAHQVLSVSQSLREKAIRLKLARASKLVVLGAGSSNGVQASDFSKSSFTEAELTSLRASLGIVDGVPVVGFIGRLNNDKGLDVLTAARAILAASSVDHQLLVVGGADGPTSPPDLEPSIGRRAIETGHVSKPAVYYQLMDLVCLPTRREGFPNVVLEAAAAGVPTVTTDATGAVDSVVHGITGMVTKVGSAEELARAMATLIADEALRHQLGQRAAQRVSELYDRPAVWQRHNEFYSGGVRSAVVATSSA